MSADPTATPAATHHQFRWLEPLKRSSLSLKLIVLTTLLTALAVSGVFLAFSFEIRSSTRRLLVEELARNQRTLLTLQERTLTQLLWTSSLLTESPTLRAAMETFRVEQSGGQRLRGALMATIQHETEKVAADLDKDLLVVTDDRGRVLAASGRRGAHPAPGEDLSVLPAVRQALDATEPVDRSSFGVVRFRGEYFQIGSVPIVLQGFAIGTLTIGERLDETVVSGVREIFDGDIVVMSEGETLTSTLPAETDLSPLRALGTRVEPTAGPAEGTVKVGADQYVAAALPLGAGQNGRPVSLVLLHSVTRATQRVNRALLFHFFVYGSLAVVLAAIGAAAASRSALGPFRAFVRFMQSVAETGRYSTRFDPRGATQEIRTLTETYNRLIDSLAQQNGQLEQRSRELVRTNDELLQQIREREQAERALKSSEDQLRQSQKLEAVGTLAGGVAHDFNNLLTVIGSYTQLAMTDLGPNSPVVADLQQVKQATHRAAALTQQLLAFSRKQMLQPKVLDLNGVVAGIERMLARLIGENIDIRTVKRTPLARVKADPGQIEQVLMNLVVNARDAMPNGGQITIETANVYLSERDIGEATVRPGPSVLLAVTDTGTGMDEATKARIFEPFFTTKGPGKGTGLGLSTVYGIVKQSGGSIWVYSEPGKGTCFKVYMPQVDEEGEAVVDGQDRGVTCKGSETVLLVEDEVQVLALARRCLDRAGYRVLSAGDGEEALRVAREHTGPIHLLLTDVVMPRMSGKELALQVVSDRPGTGVLYMSGYTDDAIVRHGILEPGTEFLQKPFAPEDLAQKVRDVLDRGRKVPHAATPTA